MSSFKTVLFSTSILISLGSAAETSAQSVPPPNPTAPVATEVVITGTRLKLPQYQAPNPIVAITGKTLQERGVTNLTDFLKTTPALANSLDSEDDANAADRGSVGLNEADLRNLGTQRTLVLVNGLRHVAGDPGTQAVDLNSIPIALIDRIDVVTGGESAIYGADAVSGVVNFILKDNYEGADVRAQAGLDTEGGGQSQQYSALLGHNFANDRANFTFDVEGENTLGVNTGDRSYQSPSGYESLVDNPNSTGPAKIFVKNAQFEDSAHGGAVFTNFDNPPPDSTSVRGVSFQGNGEPWVQGIDTGEDVMIGGSGTPLQNYREQLLPPQKRVVVNTTYHFDITPKIRFFGEAKWAKTETTLVSQPSFNFDLFVPIDNPYIPASIFNDATRNSGLGTAQGAADAGNPGPGVLVGRDNFDLGDVMEDITRNTYRFVEGFKGAATPWLDYQMAYVYGRTDTRDVEKNNRIEERFYAAADAVRDPSTGQIVCRSNLDPTAAPFGDPGLGEAPIPDFGATFTPGPNSGCVPIDVFGSGGISQAARNWINATTVQKSTIAQQDVSAYVSGRSTPLFELPAGPISYVLGGEYRRESSFFHTSDIQKQATADGFNISFLGASLDTEGAFEVYEGFTEISVPVLKDLKYTKELTVGGAYRFSSYTTAGDTNTYNLNMRWAPVQAVLFRGTLARAVRAPNVNELFSPSEQTNAELIDPCDSANVAFGTSNRLANCAADLAPAHQTPGTAPGDFNNTTSSSIQGSISGNRGLKPESAYTVTYGFVVTPPNIPNLYVSVDYYHIKIRQAIETFDAQDIVDKCVDLPRPNPFCADVSRSSDTGFINGFTQQYINISGYVTSGFDLTANYKFDPKKFGFSDNIGTFNFQVAANKLEELTFNLDATAAPDKELGASSAGNDGTNDAPTWQVSLNATWYINNFTVDYGYTYASPMRRITKDELRAPTRFIAAQYEYFSARSTHDLQVRYDFPNKWSVFAGADNLLDQQPDVDDVQPEEPVGPQGRFIYMGAEAKF